MLEQQPPWVKVRNILHRALHQGAQALCGVAIPETAAFWTSEQANDDIRVNHTSVCGRCDRTMHPKPRTTQSGDKIKAQRLELETKLGRALTAEELAYLDRRDRERATRDTRDRRQAAEREARSVDRGTSVRTVSGGLPTHGKRRR